MLTADHIAAAEARLVRVPVDPPRGDAIQKFTALELPIVTLADGAGRTGVGFGVGKPDPEEDQERVARVRETAGPGTTLMIDANQSWTVDEAVRRLRRLEPYDLAWIEEPLPATDVTGHERLARHTSIPRAGGESLYAPSHFWEYARRDGLDILQPDVVRVGGLTPALEVCHLAAAAGLRVATHVSPELSVGLAAAVPNAMFVEYIPQMEPVLAERLRIEDGQALAWDTPGHGVRFDLAALARYEATPGIE